MVDLLSRGNGYLCGGAAAAARTSALVLCCMFERVSPLAESSGIVKRFRLRMQNIHVESSRCCTMHLHTRHNTHKHNLRYFYVYISRAELEIYVQSFLVYPLGLSQCCTKKNDSNVITET